MASAVPTARVAHRSRSGRNPCQAARISPSSISSNGRDAVPTTGSVNSSDRCRVSAAAAAPRGQRTVQHAPHAASVRACQMSDGYSCMVVPSARSSFSDAKTSPLMGSSLAPARLRETCSVTCCRSAKADEDSTALSRSRPSPTPSTAST
eukprot:scaffold4451_cov133-Isochrysis_galbana.AAC.1